jgi:hypothetical protein
MFDIKTVHHVPQTVAIAPMQGPKQHCKQELCVAEILAQ